MSYIETLFLNILAVAENILIMLFAVWLDGVFGLLSFYSITAVVVGSLIVIVGLGIRFWASSAFHSGGIRVLSIKAQKSLVSNGLYKHSRNPLYIGLVLIFFGVALIFGSYTGLAFASLHFVLWHAYLLIYEERNLEKKFGETYKEYKRKVPRWI